MKSDEPRGRTAQPAGGRKIKKKKKKKIAGCQGHHAEGGVRREKKKVRVDFSKQRRGKSGEEACRQRDRIIWGKKWIGRGGFAKQGDNGSIFLKEDIGTNLGGIQKKNNPKAGAGVKLTGKANSRTRNPHPGDGGITSYWGL